ncbi:unnamed protein product [Danaus chrysippus]|uniref:(African queen) hypothetical protein n=1 Tax=Danaus chrysippus TaxID=151541 RepID=A0A8J2R6A1_9NEOP|nr:unnamed protein product [Danaus chrysippus]
MLGELQRALTLTMGEIINVRIAGLEDRLLPAKRVRPPLQADSRREAEPVAWPSKPAAAQAAKKAPSFQAICLKTMLIGTQQSVASVNASEWTIRRKLKELDFKACRPAKKPKLTAAMKTKRLKWAKQWQDKDVNFWRSVCFSDESTFEILQNKAQYVRRHPGKKFRPDFFVTTVKHPTKVMIWSVISGKGTGRLYVVKGIMRQDQYKDVLENRLIPQLR